MKPTAWRVRMPNGKERGIYSNYDDVITATAGLEGDTIEPLFSERAAPPEFIVRKAEEAIHAATYPSGMRTNGPAYARIEASHLSALLRYAKGESK